MCIAHLYSWAGAAPIALGCWVGTAPNYFAGLEQRPIMLQGWSSAQLFCRAGTAPNYFAGLGQRPIILQGCDSAQLAGLKLELIFLPYQLESLAAPLATTFPCSCLEHGCCNPSGHCSHNSLPRDGRAGWGQGSCKRSISVLHCQGC